MEQGDREVARFVVVRAWIEPGPPRTLKIRLVTRGHANAPAQVIGVTTDIDQACTLIRTWLNELTTDAGSS